MMWPSSSRQYRNPRSLLVGQVPTALCGSATTREPVQAPWGRLGRRWRRGNQVQLLENGDAFFPRVFAAIDAARAEVIVETFILFEDAVGTALRTRLIAAARRGVHVDLTVDGYGSHGLSPDFLAGLHDAGIRVHVFDPCPTMFGVRVGLFRRMHRKIVVVDGTRAFVGGINFSVEHLVASGPEAKQDYAVELQGPVVADILAFARSCLAVDLRSHPGPTRWLRSLVRRHAHGPGAPGSDDGASVLFLVRDNMAHRTAIERHYRAAIRAARHTLIIANAFFVPGYRLLRDIRNAARRGVAVTLIVQARPAQKIAIRAARMLYRYLADAGVRIYEYRRRAFHGKVAVADDTWATVGSTNFDPISLALNLEANVFVRDPTFAVELRGRLEALLEHDCVPVDPETLPRPAGRDALFTRALFQVLRRFHGWAALLPRHAPRLARARPVDRART